MSSHASPCFNVFNSRRRWGRTFYGLHNYGGGFWTLNIFHCIFFLTCHGRVALIFAFGGAVLVLVLVVSFVLCFNWGSVCRFRLTREPVGMDDILWFICNRKPGQENSFCLKKVKPRYLRTIKKEKDFCSWGLYCILLRIGLCTPFPDYTLFYQTQIASLPGSD